MEAISTSLTVRVSSALPSVSPKEAAFFFFPPAAAACSGSPAALRIFPALAVKCSARLSFTVLCLNAATSAAAATAVVKGDVEAVEALPPASF